MSNLPKEKTNIEWMEAAINSLRLDLPDSVVNKIQDKWNAHLSEQQSAIQELQKRLDDQISLNTIELSKLNEQSAAIQELCGVLEEVAKSQNGELKAEFILRIMNLSKQALQKHKQVAQPNKAFLDDQERRFNRLKH